MDVAAEKTGLRARCKALRKAMGASQVQQSSRQVAEHIMACDAYRKAKCIMGYLAFGQELSVDMVLRHALSVGKLVAVPHIISATEFVPVLLQGFEAFELDRFGIRSVPQPVRIIDPASIDLVLVPGVAFGIDGSRVGMGVGYYDRFLPQAKGAVTVGVAYEALLQRAIPCDKYDAQVEYIVSERGCRRAVSSTDKF